MLSLNLSKKVLPPDVDSSATLHCRKFRALGKTLEIKILQRAMR